MIAPELGIVVKQPGPEPHHEVELGQRTYDGLEENWPRLLQNRSVVTARGRVRITIEEELIPQLHAICHHPLYSSTLLGLHIEPYVQGKTLQEKALADPGFLTADVYEEIVLHQQICEAIGVDNGDWHSANFVVRNTDNALVHIDWGAAMPLAEINKTPEEREARLQQVKNIAYSFHDEALAVRTRQLHEALIKDQARLGNLRCTAEALASP